MGDCYLPTRAPILWTMVSKMVLRGCFMSFLSFLESQEDSACGIFETMMQVGKCNGGHWVTYIVSTSMNDGEKGKQSTDFMDYIFVNKWM